MCNAPVILAILLIACGALVEAPARAAAVGGLPPGQHAAHAKYWPRLQRWVTNFTPLSFHLGITNLTPGFERDLWFSVGEALEHIDRNGRMTQYRMPYSLWRISGIARGPDGRIWFSAGQSGRIGTVDRAGKLRMEQLVPRRHFPDIRELVVTPSGDLWFSDFGRASIGHRTPNHRKC